MISKRPKAIFVTAILPVLALVTVASLLIGLRHFVADMLTLQARYEIGQWQRHSGRQPTIQDIVRIRGQLVSGLAWLPDNPAMLESIGYLYGIQSARAERVPELRNLMLKEVILNFQQALKNRPMSCYAWANIALAKHQQNVDSDLMWRAFDRAMTYGSRERGVQIRLATVALDRWESAGLKRQVEVREMIANAKGGSADALRRLVKRSQVVSLQSMLTEPTKK